MENPYQPNKRSCVGFYKEMKLLESPHPDYFVVGESIAITVIIPSKCIYTHISVE